MHGRHAFALIALSLAAAVVAADPISPDQQGLEAKAENGNAIAQYNLGLAYLNGSGVPADPIKAYVWLTLASEQGSTAKELGALVLPDEPGQLAQGKNLLGQIRANLGIAAPVGPAPAKEAPPPAKEQAPAAEPSAIEAPAASPDVEQLKAKIKELQTTTSQQNELNQQLSQQLDERGQALLQALAQLNATKNLQDSQYAAKVAELASARQALDAAKAAAEDARKEEANKIAALQNEIAKRESDTEAVSAKLAQDEAALKAGGDSGAKAQALATELAATRGALDAANAAVKDGAKDASSKAASLEQARSDLASVRAELAQAKSSSEALSAKVAQDEAALKASGESGAKTQALAAELDKAKGDLTAAQAQLEQAKKGAEETAAKAADNQARFEALAASKAVELADARHALDAANVAAVDEKEEGDRMVSIA